MSREVAARKLAELGSRIARVRALLPAARGSLAADRTASEALLLNLYLALQLACDLAHHLVADRSLGVPGGAREAFQLLGTSEPLAGPLAEPDLRA